MEDNLEITSSMEQIYSDVLLEFFQWQQLQEENLQVSFTRDFITLYKPEHILDKNQI